MQNSARERARTRRAVARAWHPDRGGDHEAFISAMTAHEAVETPVAVCALDVTLVAVHQSWFRRAIRRAAVVLARVARRQHTYIQLCTTPVTAPRLSGGNTP